MNLYPVIPYLTATIGLLLGAGFTFWRFWHLHKRLSSQLKQQRISNKELNDKHQSVKDQLHNLLKAHDRLNNTYNKLYADLDESRKLLQHAYTTHNQYLDRITKQQGVIQNLQSQHNSIQKQQIIQSNPAQNDLKLITMNHFSEAVKKQARQKAKKRLSGKDNLKKVKGISSSIENTLNHAGINTWSKLAQMDVEELKQLILQEGRKTSSLYDPTTWPKQAALAAKGRWKELRVWQKRREELQVLNEMVKQE